MTADLFDEIMSNKGWGLIVGDLLLFIIYYSWVLSLFSNAKGLCESHWHF